MKKRTNLERKNRKGCGLLIRLISWIKVNKNTKKKGYSFPRLISWVKVRRRGGWWCSNIGILYHSRYTVRPNTIVIKVFYFDPLILTKCFVSQYQILSNLFQTKSVAGGPLVLGPVDPCRYLVT